MALWIFLLDKTLSHLSQWLCPQKPLSLVILSLIFSPSAFWYFSTSACSVDIFCLASGTRGRTASCWWSAAPNSNQPGPVCGEFINPLHYYCNLQQFPVSSMAAGGDANGPYFRWTRRPPWGSILTQPLPLTVSDSLYCRAYIMAHVPLRPGASWLSQVPPGTAGRWSIHPSSLNITAFSVIPHKDSRIPERYSWMLAWSLGRKYYVTCAAREDGSIWLLIPWPIMPSLWPTQFNSRISMTYVFLTATW